MQSSFERRRSGKVISSNHSITYDYDQKIKMATQGQVDERNGRIARMVLTRCETVAKTTLVALPHVHQYGWTGFDRITYVLIEADKASSLEAHASSAGARTSASFVNNPNRAERGLRCLPPSSR